MSFTIPNRERELASEKRAGSWLQRKAVEQQRQFLRDNPRVLAILLGLYLIVLPGLWLQPEWARGFFLGAWTATIVATAVLLTWQLSGVGYLQQGELAEQWTVQALRPVTKRDEWRLINHVLLKPWDIDHVVLGPAGVVVIETKGGSTDWTDRRHEPRIREAVRQVKDNARDVRLYLRPDIDQAPVRPVVALWPLADGLQTYEIDGVTVMSGHRLRDWVESLPGEQLSTDGVEAGWSRIEKHLEKRDAADLERHGRPPRTVSQMASDFVQYPIGICLGFLAVAPILRLFAFPVDWAVVVLAAAGAALCASRFPRLQRLLNGTCIGLAGSAAIVAVVLSFEQL